MLFSKKAFFGILRFTVDYYPDYLLCSFLLYVAVAYD
jgi:hypothetical protein